jgi:hypothetical protein
MRRAAILTLLFTGLLSSLSAQSAEEIIQRNSATLSVPSLQGSLQLELISKSGEVRKIEAAVYQQSVGESQCNRLFVFEFPPTVRGTGLLLHSFTDGRPNDMWIYLPTIRRIKRIALESSGSGFFMGSDFTYRDLIDNDYNNMGIERLPDRTIEGIDSYVVKAWGNTLKQRQEHGYAYLITYYRKDNYMVHRREYYDLDGSLLKIYEVESFIEIDHFIYPDAVSMNNVQTGHRSEIKVKDISLDPVPDQYFTTRYLQRS